MRKDELTNKQRYTVTIETLTDYLGNRQSYLQHLIDNQDKIKDDADDTSDDYIYLQIEKCKYDIALIKQIISHFKLYRDNNIM